MGFIDWLTGNSTAKRNNVKIAKVKRELQFMTKDQKIRKLRGFHGNLYTRTDFEVIDDIYACDYDLTTDFLIYYLLFMNDDIRNEVEVEEQTIEIEGMKEAVMIANEIMEEVANTESITSEDVMPESTASDYSNTSSETSESVPDSSYDCGSSCDSGGDCGGCD